MLLVLQLACSHDIVADTGDPVDLDEDGFTPAEGDCDDDDATVHPGAVERCDEQQNDCAADWSSDQGLASFVSASGAWTDLTEQLSDGQMGAPVQVGLTEPGTLRLCGGVWFLSLQLTDDLAVVGTGRESTYLSGAGAVSAVVVRYDGVEASLTDLTLEDGVAHTDVTIDDEALAVGGGLLCDGHASVALTNVAVRGNQAEAGGGLASLGGCDVTLDQVAFTDNVAASDDGSALGGALLLQGGEATASAASFTGNTATADEAHGGALALLDATLTLDEGSFMQNEASTQGGALYARDSQLAWSAGSARYSQARLGGALHLSGGTSTLQDVELAYGTAPGDGSAGGALFVDGGEVELSGCDLHDNTAETGGGLYLDVGELTATGCDFADNTPEDVRATSSGSHDYGEAASFSCLDGVCTD